MNINNLKIIGQGNTAEIFAYEDNKILKLFREGISEEIATLEYEKAVFVQTYITNVPKAYDLIKINNRHGIIYERINGQDMIVVMIKSITKVNYYSRMLARSHSIMHKNLVEFDEGFSMKDKLRADIEAVEVISNKQKEFLIKYLEDLPEGESLCHFDFHPGNVIIQGKESIIIDWMTACVGNPCADIARTYVVLTYGELPNAKYLVRKLVGLFQKHVGKVYYKEYLKLSKLEEKEIEQWILPVAAARLREWIPESEKKALLAFINNSIL